MNLRHVYHRGHLRAAGVVQLATLSAQRRHMPSTKAVAGHEPAVVVSLTTYPARLARARNALQSLLWQRYPSKQVMLVLCRDEFAGISPPRWLRELEQHGLSITWVDNSRRCYNKLLPVVETHPDSVVVTADDDTLYPRWWLSRLVDGHLQYPHDIIGHRGTEMIPVASRRFAPYVTWPGANAQTPSNRIFLTGVGGILYPPGSLPVEVRDYELAEALCPTNDDIWLKAMSLLSGAKPRLLGASKDFPSVATMRSTPALRDLNVGAHQNDSQVQQVFDYFDLWRTVAP